MWGTGPLCHISHIKHQCLHRDAEEQQQRWQKCNAFCGLTKVMTIKTQLLMGLMKVMEVIINEKEMLTVGTGQIG